MLHTNKIDAYQVGSQPVMHLGDRALVETSHSIPGVGHNQDFCEKLGVVKWIQDGTRIIEKIALQ